jgi:hypothetical protein
MDAIKILVVQQTQPIIQGVWLSVLVMGIVERPFAQRNILVTTP